MNKRPAESRTWRNLVVLPSMDVIDAGAMSDLGFHSDDFPALQAELRVVIRDDNFNSSSALSLWQTALHRIETALGRKTRENFETWGMALPCDSDAVLPELDAWERTWPDLATILRTSSAAAPWGEPVAAAYRSMTRKSAFEQRLEERLSLPLSDWDKTCFTQYAHEDLMSEAEFFTTLNLGADRLALAQFWRKVAADLSPERKDMVWTEGQDVWARMHGAMTDADLKFMRAEFADQNSFEAALAALRSYNPSRVQLPHPDMLLSYA
jgi:hypothetical protein